MGQMIDTPTLSGLARQIRIDEPDILLVACDAKKLPRDMAHLIDGSFSQLDVHLIPRRFADAKLGLEILSDFGSPEFKIVDQQFYMLAAVSGVFSFLEKCKTEFGRLHSVQFKTVPNDSCLYLGENLYQYFIPLLLFA